MEALNIWVIYRDGSTSDMFECSEFEVNPDYLSMEKSSFSSIKSIRTNRGDFIFAKEPYGGSFSYFGVIDSYENNEIIANSILSLVNFEFPACRMKGTSFEAHAKNLITKYLINDATKLLDNLVITVKSNTAHNYQPAESPTPTNLMKYLINGFKKYNVVWKFESFSNGVLQTSLERISKKLPIKDNSPDFVDWDVSTTEVGKGVDNHIIIVDKKSTNSESPIVLSQWYLTTDNEVTQTAGNKVMKPTITRVYVYDTEEDPETKPSYQDVAESEIKGSYYSHEISVSVHYDNKLISISKLELGSLFTIYYRGRVHESVLTGMTVTSGSMYTTLKFGHIRSRLSELLE